MGQHELAAKMIALLYSHHPQSIAVTLTHAANLRRTDPQQSCKVMKRWLDKLDTAPAPSANRAAALAAAAMSYNAAGQLRRALWHLRWAVRMWKRVQLLRRVRSGKQPLKAAPGVSREELKRCKGGLRPDFTYGRDMFVPKLQLGSEVGAIKMSDGWLSDRVCEARLALSQSMLIHRPPVALDIAEKALKMGRLQIQTHYAMAQASVAVQDWAKATQHISKGLRMWPYHAGILRTFSAMLHAQGRVQDAVLVATYARSVTSRGRTPPSGEVKAAYRQLRDSVLGAA